MHALSLLGPNAADPNGTLEAWRQPAGGLDRYFLKLATMDSACAPAPLDGKLVMPGMYDLPFGLGAGLAGGKSYGGSIYGGDGTVGSGMYCSLYECKRKAGVPVSKANAKRSPGFSYPHMTPPRQAASEAQQPPDSAKASSQPDVIDLELDGASLEALVCIQSVKKILALRVCKDIARLTPSEVESLQPGSSTYQRAYLILADFLFAAGIQALRGAVRWVPEDILIEMAECNESLGEVDIACALAVFRNGLDSSQKD